MVADVLNARGALEFDKKEYSSAESTYLQALTLAREAHNARQEASSLGNLARVAIVQGHFSDGIDQSQVALQLGRSMGMHSLEATLLGNLGWCYFQLGDFENALLFFKPAAEASQRIGLTGYSFYWQGNIAQSYQELNDYASAQALLRTTLENARKLNNKQTMTEALNYLTRLSLKTNQLDQAGHYNQEALQIEEAGLDHFGVLETQLLLGRIDAHRQDFPRAEQLFREVIKDPAAEVFLKWEAEARLAEMLEAESLTAQAEQEFRKSIEAFESARSAIGRDELRLSFLTRGIESYEAYIDFLIRHGRLMDALKIADQSRARTLAEGLSSNGQGAASHASTHIPPEQLARRLHATLLFYWLGQKNSYLWVIGPQKTTVLALAPDSEIAPVVKSYRKALIESRDVLAAKNADAEKLYSLLVEPVKELIPKDGRVILLPDTSIYGLNFETLIVPDPQPHFWIEDVTVTTSSSLTMLAASAGRPAVGGKSLLLVGNTESPNQDFPALPQAPEEMQRIEHYFLDQNRKVLEGKGATPTAYLSSRPEKFAYLHFVTHGTASHTRPLESAVILSREGDSYKLYARDIVQHHLNANLVTISACNGAGTRTYSGEGLVGLSWAFQRAGAHNVIGALWEVSDASTPQLMDSLYAGLSRGKDPATALRDAKLSLLHSKADTAFKKPFYWAPFQLYSGS
jgi:CHAT domain-containing protein